MASSILTCLTSSPCLEGSGEINPDNGFIEMLHRIVPRGSRILFVSSKPDDADFSDWCAFSLATSLENCGLSFDDCRVLDDRSQDQVDEELRDCNFMILGGGHVPTQNAFLERIALRERLKAFHGVVMGISAGSMNCADVVYVQPEEPGESDPDFPRTARGLGLVKTNILPHYQKTRDTLLDNQRLYEDITFQDSFGRDLFAIVDGSYLINDGVSETMYGESYRLRDGHMTLFSSKDQSRRIRTCARRRKKT